VQACEGLTLSRSGSLSQTFRESRQGDDCGCGSGRLQEHGTFLSVSYVCPEPVLVKRSIFA
jgi:hypothetical protein